MAIGNLFLVSVNNQVSDNDQPFLEEMSKKEMDLVNDIDFKKDGFQKSYLFFDRSMTLSEGDLNLGYSNEDTSLISYASKNNQGNFIVVKAYSLYRNSSLVSLALSYFLKGKGVSATDIGMLDLCVTEIFNNVIEHAYLKECEKPIVIICNVDSGGIHISIFDEAEPSLQKIHVSSSEAYVGEEEDSGRGIGIVKAVMDECSTEFLYNRNAFFMSKRFEAQGCA